MSEFSILFIYCYWSLTINFSILHSLLFIKWIITDTYYFIYCDSESDLQLKFSMFMIIDGFK